MAGPPTLQEQIHWQVSRVSPGPFLPVRQMWFDPQAPPPRASGLRCHPRPRPLHTLCSVWDWTPPPTAKLALIPTRPPGGLRWAPRHWGRPCSGGGQPARATILPGLGPAGLHGRGRHLGSWGWGWRRVPQVPESVVRVLRAGASEENLGVGRGGRRGLGSRAPSPLPPGSGGPYTFRKVLLPAPPTAKGGIDDCGEGEGQEARPVRKPRSGVGGSGPGTPALTSLWSTPTPGRPGP